MILGFDLDGVTCTLDPLLLDMIEHSAGLSRGWGLTGDKFLPEDPKILDLRTAYFETQRPLLDVKSLLGPRDSLVVITGRPQWAKEVTEQWMKKFYPGISVYLINSPNGLEESWGWSDRSRQFLLYTTEWVASQKAKLIKGLGVSVYFEDTSKVVELLRTLVYIPIVHVSLVK